MVLDVVSPRRIRAPKNWFAAPAFHFDHLSLFHVASLIRPFFSILTLLKLIFSVPVSKQLCWIGFSCRDVGQILFSVCYQLCILLFLHPCCSFLHAAMVLAWPVVAGAAPASLWPMIPLPRTTRHSYARLITTGSRTNASSTMFQRLRVLLFTMNDTRHKVQCMHHAQQQSAPVAEVSRVWLVRVNSGLWEDRDNSSISAIFLVALKDDYFPPPVSDPKNVTSGGSMSALSTAATIFCILFQLN